MAKWQPIETAPRDRWILVSASELDPDGGYPGVVAKWAMTSKDTDHFMWARVDGTWMTVTSDQVTHWHELPELPHD